MTLPQVFKIWIGQNASGVSVISWLGYLIAAWFWLLYGFIHKEKPIIVTYLTWTVLVVMVIVGTLLYS